MQIRKLWDRKAQYHDNWHLEICSINEYMFVEYIFLDSTDSTSIAQNLFRK